MFLSCVFWFTNTINISLWALICLEVDFKKNYKIKSTSPVRPRTGRSEQGEEGASEVVFWLASTVDP